MATFGERLKFLRDQKGVTQEDLAELLGVNKQTISGYERGVRKPDFERLDDPWKFMKNWPISSTST